ncbi:hypothetical protein BG004_008265 [Podila humilis]|nr:hypothetical protein BG004_008265 [Podila humilis]
MDRRQGNNIDVNGRVGTAALPPHLLRLFAPRPPLPYAAPLDKDPSTKRESKMMPISQYLDMLKDHDKDYVPTLSIAERKKKKAWDPNNDPHVVGDPYKTLHVSRLSYDCTEKDLRREFSMYGQIENIRVVKDQNDKSRGFAFIEFEREKDMKAAYKDADGIKILGRRILVDVERGRTVKGWKPKRLGGGLGSTRVGAPHENRSSTGRESARSRDRSRGGERDRGVSSRYSVGSGGDRDRDRGSGANGRRHDRGGYSDRPYERDSKRRKSRSRSRSPMVSSSSRGYGDSSSRGRDNR